MSSQSSRNPSQADGTQISPSIDPARLREARAAFHASIEGRGAELAKLLGWSESKFSRWRSGDVANGGAVPLTLDDALTVAAFVADHQIKLTADQYRVLHTLASLGAQSFQSSMPVPR